MYIVFSRFKWKPPYIVSVTWPSALHGYLNLKNNNSDKTADLPFK